MIGTKLGHYEITSHLGTGGMGEVYQATDSKLGRSVAIKLLPEAFTHDADRTARFEREARVLASLNHPNIAAIYGVEESGGRKFLVMELVSGETLAEKIKRGVIPLEEALGIALQITEALEAAHEKGVVHRDLKPGNVMLTSDGRVKVLDFGLAKAYDTNPSSATLSNSPTVASMAATNAGVILGTAAYMSPEQARGKLVDKRADIWAFGVVLYEMVSGKRPFDGEDLTEVLAAVVKEQPDLGRVPALLRPVLQRCLEKDPRKRLRDISGVSLLLERPPSAPSQVRWPWAAAAGAFAVLAVAAYWAPWHTEPVLEIVRFEVRPPDAVAFNNARPAISPDGRNLAYIVPAGVGNVWIRSLDSVEGHPLPGGQGAYGTLFWSPDSRSVAFIGGTQGNGGTQARIWLRRADIAGGPAQTLFEISDGGGGGDWSRDGVILVGGRGLIRVPATSGEPIPATTLDTSRGETFHRFPSFLPDGKHFLYLRLSSKPENTGIYVGSLDAKPDQQDLKRLLPADAGAIYAPLPGSRTGYLLFLRQDSLMAQPFDPGRLELSGEAHPIAQAGNGGPGVGGYFSASTTGALAYRSLPAGGPGTLRIAVLDRQGKLLTSVGELGTYVTPSFSPDETQVVYARSGDIWLHDFTRSTPVRLTFNPATEFAPVWSPDGKYVAFASDRDGPNNIYRKVASNAGTEELLLKSDETKTPTDWSHDGRFLLFTIAKSGSTEIWTLPLDGPDGKPGKPALYLKETVSQGNAKFSPDGHYVAFQSDANGRTEVYVQTFPDPTGGRWQISTTGGSFPRWQRDGKQLYFIVNRNLMAAEVTLNPSFNFKAPTRLAELPLGPGAFDVGGKGEKFVKAGVAAASTDAPPPPITVVLNWQTAIPK
jgi:Tol biopolymer transport system component